MSPCACSDGNIIYQTRKLINCIKFVSMFIWNHITYASLLSLCSHVGYVGGFEYFNQLNQGTNMFSSAIDHKNCLVNLFGGVGRLKDAQDILQSMPERPNTVTWRSLLSHSKSYGSLGQGQYCFKIQ